MTIEITRGGKSGLVLSCPVMPAAGTFGYGDVYRDMVNIDHLGAIVTSPVTYEPWNPATGTRVVPLDAGVLVHTGLPNLGLNKTLKKYRNLWTVLPVPVILHLVATTAEQVRKSVSRLDEEECVAAIELGLNDDIGWRDAETFVKSAVEKSEKPIIVRLPMQDAYEIAETVADAGADAVVIAAPPRGTARDPKTGRLVSGRVYGPLVKPMVLRMVGNLVRRLKDVPVIGAGGIHTPQDARDFIEAGAVAVQVDSVTWIKPEMLEFIARDLSGLTATRRAGAFPDEWYPGMMDAERQTRGDAQ